MTLITPNLLQASSACRPHSLEDRRARDCESKGPRILGCPLYSLAVEVWRKPLNLFDPRFSSLTISPFPLRGPGVLFCLSRQTTPPRGHLSGTCAFLSNGCVSLCRKCQGGSWNVHTGCCRPRGLCCPEKPVLLCLCLALMPGRFHNMFHFPATLQNLLRLLKFPPLPPHGPCSPGTY